MPQDRRTAFQTTQHTAQAPIVQPRHRSRSRSAESSKLWGLFSATSAAILRTCGRPVVRTQRVDHPPRDELGPWIRGRITGPLLGPTPRIGLSPRRRRIDQLVEVCQSGDPPTRRQPTPQPSTTTTSTSQPSTSSAAAADLQGNQLGPWSAADIGYTHAPTLPGHSSAIPGAPRR